MIQNLPSGSNQTASNHLTTDSPTTYRCGALLRRASRFIGHLISGRAGPISSLGFLDLRNGQMPVILSTAVGLPFIQPDHVRAVSNFFIVFVDSRFCHLHLFQS
jgi:hypothetical protein